jgi:hypothetical protein
MMSNQFGLLVEMSKGWNHLEFSCKMLLCYLMATRHIKAQLSFSMGTVSHIFSYTKGSLMSTRKILLSCPDHIA